MICSSAFHKIIVIVAHPDDETIWSGGTLLASSGASISIVSLCRGNDPDRAPKFRQAAMCYNALPIMGALDDEPEQLPLEIDFVKSEIIRLAGNTFNNLDLVITHSPKGEYTRHRRHEEIGLAVSQLWSEGIIKAKRIWLFAYKDDGPATIPKPVSTASICDLRDEIFAAKHNIIAKIYGFSDDSFEAKSVSRREAFWCFESRMDLTKWTMENTHESAGAV